MGMIAPRCELTVQSRDENDTRTTITLERAKVIGRAPECDVCLHSRSVSARHATVRWHDGTLEVMDLGSSYGTFVDDVRIDSWAPVTAESVVWTGDVSLRFVLVWAPIPTPIYFTSSNIRSAFTISGDSDSLTPRELVDFPAIAPFLPIRFQRSEGAISAVVDGADVVHYFEDGRLKLGSVELALVADDDSMASLMAPVSSSRHAEEGLESVTPPMKATTEQVAGANAGQGMGGTDVESEPAAEPSQPGLGVPNDTLRGRAGVDWLMLLMGIAALIALGAFAAWILQ